jgi:hypothetical protein
MTNDLNVARYPATGNRPQRKPFVLKAILDEKK